jgi:hypothetical protein
VLLLESNAVPAGVALRQAGRLDTALIIQELAPLLDLKGTTEDLARLERLLASARTPE